MLTGYKFLLIILINSLAIRIFSQDVIVKKDNTELKVKIIEIQENSIKYKPIDFLDGPLRSISLTDVIKIIYENGRIENFIILKEEKIDTAPAAIIESPGKGYSTNPSTYYPFSIFGRLSIQFWRNDALSEFFGNNPMFGGGLEKQIIDDFKVGIDLDYATKTKDDETVRYIQSGVFFNYSWYPFGSNRPNICPGFGITGVSVKDTYYDDVDKAAGIGISTLVEIEIPIGNSMMIDIGWNSVFSKIKFDEELINVGSEMIYIGVAFNLF